ncbi:PE-PPE domain-containing protein [Mycobacterium sp. IS-1742]|nr:PE-PPE domain-containing protein [Mycobacterium sp. IS-1742]
MLLGNGSRPNGGLMSRFDGAYLPILDVSFTGPTPTTTAGAAPGEITTYDIARQYDLFADFPTNPLNILAVANAFAGQIFVHPDYGSVDMSQAVFQGTYGDTAYYLIPTYPLPLLTPLTWIPVVGPIAVDILDPILRVLVEAGYDRTVNPGAPTPADFHYFPDPLTFGTSLLHAIPAGLTYGVQDVLHMREPGTPPAGVAGQDAYGIGAPSVTLPDQTPPPAPVQTMVAPSAPDLSTPAGTGPSAPADLPVPDVVNPVPSSPIPPAPEQNIARDPVVEPSPAATVKRSVSTTNSVAEAPDRPRPSSGVANDRPRRAGESNGKSGSGTAGKSNGKNDSGSTSN